VWEEDSRLTSESELLNLPAAPPESRTSALTSGAEASAIESAAASKADPNATPSCDQPPGRSLAAEGGPHAGFEPRDGAGESSESESESESDAPQLAPRNPRPGFRRQAVAEAAALPDDEAEARVRRAYMLGREGLFELSGGKPASMSALHRAARAAQRAAVSGEDPRVSRPCAADTEALWAAAPRQLLFTKAQDEAFAAPPRVDGPRVHPRVDAAVPRNWHLDDGCAACKAKRPCYIFSLRRNMEAFELPFRPGAVPTVKVEPRRARRYDLNSPEGRKMAEIVNELEEGDVFERVSDENDINECICISPVHLAQKQSISLSAEERTAADALNMQEMSRLATLHASRIVDALVTASGGLDWTRSTVDTVMASHRDGPIKWRFVVGLHTTVNDLVEDWDFTYVDFEAEWAASDHPWTADDLVSKKDLVKGFYSVEIAQHHRKYFCFRDPRDPEGKRVLRYKRLPMGFKLAPALYSALTSEVARHLNASEHGRAGALYRFYVDDLAMKALKARATAAYAFAGAEVPKARLPWGTGPGKDEPPAQRNVITGRLFDSDVDGRPMVRVDPVKLYTALVDLEVLRLAAERAPDAARLPVEWLRSMAGRVSWVAQSTYSARLHTSSLWYAAMHAKRSSDGMVRLRAIRGLVADAGWFRSQAQAGKLRGAHYVRPDELTPDSVEVVCADAAGEDGAAALWDDFVIYHGWNSAERSMSIQAKELDPFVAAADVFGESWKGKIVVFYTDNLGNAYSINNGKTAHGAASDRLARLYELADQHGFEFIAVWLPRRFNTKADAVSKAASFEDAVKAAVACGATSSAEKVFEYPSFAR